jgi:hypothetical protein
MNKEVEKILKSCPVDVLLAIKSFMLLYPEEKMYKERLKLIEELLKWS